MEIDEKPIVYCPDCGNKMRVDQSSVQFYKGEPTVWRRRRCKSCNDGKTYHTIEIPKPDDMKVDFG